MTMALCALLLGTPARAAETVLNTTQDSFYPRMIRLAASGGANGLARLQRQPVGDL
jgi:hypothetical protein